MIAVPGLTGSMSRDHVLMIFPWAYTTMPVDNLINFVDTRSLRKVLIDTKVAVIWYMFAVTLNFWNQYEHFTGLNLFQALFSLALIVFVTANIALIFNFFFLVSETELSLFFFGIIKNCLQEVQNWQRNAIFFVICLHPFVIRKQPRWATFHERGLCCYPTDLATGLSALLRYNHVLIEKTMI